MSGEDDILKGTRNDQSGQLFVPTLHGERTLR